MYIIVLNCGGLGLYRCITAFKICLLAQCHKKPNLNVSAYHSKIIRISFPSTMLLSTEVIIQGTTNKFDGQDSYGVYFSFMPCCTCSKGLIKAMITY